MCYSYFIRPKAEMSSERGQPGLNPGKDEQTQDLVYAADILKVQATPCNSNSR